MGESQSQEENLETTLGYHITYVSPDSVLKNKVEPWLDYLTHANNTRLNKNVQLKDYIDFSKPLKLTFYNSRDLDFRDIPLDSLSNLESLGIFHS
jgi:hypothetical protein